MSIEEKNFPELFISDQVSYLFREPDRNGTASNYKSASIAYATIEYSINLLSQYGGSMRKLKWSAVEITSSNLFKIISILPSLEEIELKAHNSFKIDTTIDLSRIKSLHCDSKSCLKFFSSLMPANCLNEFHMNYYGQDNRIIDVDNFEKFIQHQTSIRIFSTNRKIPLNALNLLTLDELKLGNLINERNVINVLKDQPELKSFSYKRLINLVTFDEICKLSKLEVLKLNVRNITYGQSFERMKNLKELELSYIMDHHQQSFLNFKLESLEKLSFENFTNELISNPEIIERISLNFPNLKALKLKSSQKLNYIAKLFQNLNELKIIHTPIWELDTGIVNQNLTKLTMDIEVDFCVIDEMFLELFEIFPNLETLEIESLPTCKNRSLNHMHSLKLFENLIKLDKLKSIELSCLEFKNYSKIYLDKLAEDIKKLSQKFKYVNLFFVSCDYSVPESDFNPLKSNYYSFVNKLKNDFNIQQNDLSFDCEDIIHCRLHICSGIKY